MLKLQRTFILVAVFAMLLTGAMAQNLLTNGDFATGNAGWTEVVIGSEGATVAYDLATTLPTGGAAPALRITAVDGDNDWSTNQAIYRAVTLNAMRYYHLDGVVRDIAPAGSQFWIEFYILSAPPSVGVDPPSGKICGNGGWNPGPGFDCALDAFTDDPNNDFSVPSDGTYYIVIKGGCGDNGDVESNIDVAVDNLVLTDVGAVPTYGDNILVNGDFATGDNTGWIYETIGDHVISVDYNATTSIPTGAVAPSLRLYALSAGHTDWETAGCVYQGVTLLGGNQYVVDWKARDVAGVSDNWLEVRLKDTPPVNGEDVIDSNSIELSSGEPFVAADNAIFYLVIKAGCGGQWWDGTGTEPPLGNLDRTVDNVTLRDFDTAAVPVELLGFSAE